VLPDPLATVRGLLLRDRRGREGKGGRRERRGGVWRGGEGEGN